MPRFKISPVTEALVAYLRAHEKGTQVSYQELSRAVGAEITSISHTLTSARRILSRQYNQVWDCVKPRVGLQRLNDSQIATRLPEWWMRGARRKLVRGGNESSIVESTKLDIAEQARFGVACVQRELAEQSLSLSMTRRLERVARGSSNDLPSFNIVEWAINLTRK